MHVEVSEDGQKVVVRAAGAEFVIVAHESSDGREIGLLFSTVKGGIALRPRAGNSVSIEAVAGGGS